MNWDSILLALAGTSEQMIRAIQDGPRKHGPCPVHGGRNGDAFRVHNDFQMTGGSVCNTCGHHPDGFATLMWLFGWDYVKAIKEVGAAIGLQYGNGFVASQPAAVSVVAAPAKEEDPQKVARRDDRRAREMGKLWSESVSILDRDAGIARAYLKARGIDRVVGPLEDLRFHPAVSYWENNVDIGEFPAMLRLLRQPNGEPLTLERLYLTAEGAKAAVEKQKKIMSPRSTSVFNGSCVRLDHEVGTVLCVAEGVETALSWRAMTGLPTWAATTAGLMESLVIPRTVELVIVAGDKDPLVRDQKGELVEGRGERAAKILVDRLKAANIKAAILLPPYKVPADRKKLDWNDVHAILGTEAARQEPFAIRTRERVKEMLEEMGYEWSSAHAHH
ncbi:DUF7146 domain-containing protein [Luteimonas sp. MHLX1A]|uniref:DUF7146 domain-containing protein n=1 Tax=Alterluteimonas muca TaxID=2878684 RepID=UPI001E37921E|nr:toprim domain-containing protein [Luteimonas sp. MHLX1A]MCD9046914.1 toprim domain-containing protein [Luteimonas sp. MHLX1A]